MSNQVKRIRVVQLSRTLFAATAYGAYILNDSRGGKGGGRNVVACAYGETNEKARANLAAKL